ncbi:MAG: TonB-dependent receptor, partial [Caulobacteraceae bacterium]
SAAKRKYVNVPDRFGGAAGNIPCSNDPEPINCTTERDTPVRFPDVQATLGATYKMAVPSLNGAVNFNGSVSYSQSYWSSSYNDGGLLTAIPFGGTTPVTVPFAKTPASTLLNLGVVYRTDDGHWAAALECANCTNEYYVTSSLFGVGYYNDPRRVTLRLKYNY